LIAIAVGILIATRIIWVTTSVGDIVARWMVRRSHDDREAERVTRRT
jgi:hypothetical protein